MRYQNRRIRARALTTSSAIAIAISAFAGTAPMAFAQEGELITVDEEEEEETDNRDRVTVTGSRIQRQDYTANSPIVTVSQDTFENTSTIGLSTVLNQLPQFVPALTQFIAGDIQPSAQNTVGSATVNLRGLGSNRSLVLVDGRRAPPINAALVADTNAISSSAIQRVEIISGGASAVYGADAVGGVVNFILKNNFEGFDFETRYGVSELGDNTEFSASALFGANVANGRGNVMMSVEHASRGNADRFNRDWAVDQLADPYVNPTDFWFSEPYFGRISGSRNYPDQNVVDQVFSQAVPCDPDGAGPEQPVGSTCEEGVNRLTNWYINKDPDGNGQVFTGVRTFIGASNVAGAYKYTGELIDPETGLQFRKIHPDGSVGQNNLLSNLSRPLERYTAFGRGRYEITDNITAVAQTMFARTRTETLSQYTAALGSNAVIIPYGSEIWEDSVDAEGNTLPAYLPGGAYGLTECGPVGGCTETQVFPLPMELRMILDSRLEDPDEDVTINTALDFVGNRVVKTESMVFQVNFGLEGELWNGWVWDATVSHSEADAITDLYGDVSRERYRAVASAPNFGRAFQRVGNADFGGSRAGSAQCTSGLPLVADFEITQDCLEAIESVTHNDQNVIQNMAEANLAGDLFDLPAGTLAASIGAGYREYEYEYNVDNLQRYASFVENSSGIRPINPSTGYYSLAEIYGELLVPVITNVPFIQQLNLELGGRYSDFSTVGGVDTFKILADWSVNDYLRFRGGYNKATRAPNIAELFQARTSVFQGSGAQFGDQCSQNNQDAPYGTNPDSNVNGATGAAFALDLCRAIMGESAATFYYDEREIADQPDPGGAGTPNSIGNPDVGAETADTYTLGLVFRSPFEGNPFLGGFSGSIDYFTIELTDMIAAANPDTVYQQCLDPDINTAGDPNTLACQSIIRDLVTGAALNVDTGFTNEGASTTTGLDVQVDWRGQFEDLGLDAIPGGLSLNVIASFNLENTTQETPDTPVYDWTGTQGCALGLSCMRYDYRVFTTFNYFTGPFSASLRWQHYPSVLSGAVVTNPDTDAVGVPTSYNVFALTGSYRVTDNLQLRAGVENLFDTLPPLSGGNINQTGFPSSPTRAGGGTYDPIGRRYYVGLSASF